MNYLNFLLVCISILSACTQASKKEPPVVLTPVKAIAQKVVQPKTYEAFDRKTCLQAINAKRKKGEALVIHLKVPLCDNEHQGIVPVSEKLGNGFDLNNNLYWGAKYGIKNYFKRYTKWTLQEVQHKVNQDILERLVFSQELPNGVKAYLVADAYRGDKMKACLKSFLEASSGRNKEKLKILNEEIGINGLADFLIFNGHNGLMEYDLDYIENEDDKIREVAVIACASFDYFESHLKHAKAYPLLTTTNLMAPEAYVAHAVIMGWLNQLEEGPLRTEVAKAYHRYQKCGIKGAKRLFKTSW